MAQYQEKLFYDCISQKEEDFPIEFFDKMFTLSPHLIDKRFQGEGWTPLMFAIKFGRNDIVKLLVEKFKARVDMQNDEGSTALIYAIKYKNLSVARYLLKNSANVNLQNYKGETALFYAKNKEAAKLLIDNGSDINIENKFGMRAYTLMDYMAPKVEIKKRKELNKFIQDYYASKKSQDIEYELKK